MGRRKKHVRGGKKQNKALKFKKLLNKRIQELIFNNKDQVWDYNHVAKELHITSVYDKQLINEILRQLYDQEYLQEVAVSKYKYNTKNQKIVTGVLDLNKKGNGYLISDELDKDVFIAQNNLNQAFHKDTVEVSLKPGKRLEGEVVKVLERNKNQWVCTLEVSQKFAFAIPDDSRMPYDFYIPLNQLNNAKDGNKVVVQITEWKNNTDNPFGKITEVLGDPGNNETEIHAILAEYALPYKFPINVEEDAKNVDTTISNKEIDKRKDFRDITTFTIDPIDAKDFDDALSYEELENGNIRVGIHIADVSHYVKPGTDLDKEAYNRGNSVYLVDRVVPMLPEVLSNLVCSLRPHEEKYCFSAVFELTLEGDIKDKWFGKTIIHSDRRFTYEEAQEIIEGKSGDFEHEIRSLDSIAKKIRAKRMTNGALEIMSREVKFRLDEDGYPIGVFYKESKDANKLIEEFMLIANQEVAKFIAIDKHNLKVPFVYRIHDNPDQEKLSKLADFVKKFGYKIDPNSKDINLELNTLLKEVTESTESHIISTMAIRTMAKAIYSNENVGHFGLGFTHYTHFTSPIRRYADLVVHRQLQKVLEEKSINQKENLSAVCKHISSTEKTASNAERDSIKFKQIQFLQDKVGEEFEGVISSLTEWGMYVELTENFCEGMIALKSLKDDVYYFDQENFRVIGHNKKKSYSLGQHIKVVLTGTDLIKKNIDFEIV